METAYQMGVKATVACWVKAQGGPEAAAKRMRDPDALSKAQGQ
jgi:hypothetical protein